MKKLLPVALLLSLPTAYADGVLDAFESYQGSLSAGPSSNKSVGPSPAPSQNVERSSNDGKTCDEDQQSSLPLKFVTNLIMQKDGALSVSFDASANELKVSAPNMVSNCSSMLDWKVRDQKVGGKQSYAIEAKFKKNPDCDDKLGCMYKVAKVENGEFKAFEQVRFQPNKDGFVECLKYAGVLKEEGGQKKVDVKAIYPAPLVQRFPNVVDSGDVEFVSHGPSSALDGAKYGDFTSVNTCDYFEKINPQTPRITSAADLAAQADADAQAALEKEATDIGKCGQYTKITEFMNEHQQMQKGLIDIRNKLLMDAVKKASANIAAGKGSDDDFKAINDFDKYIVSALINDASRLYKKLEDASNDDEKKAIQKLIDADLKELATYTKKPFIEKAVVQRLINDGKFDDAKNIFGITVNIDTFAKLGRKENNVVYTPQVVMKTVSNLQDEFGRQADIAQEKYEIKTGQVTGKAQGYANGYKVMMQRIQVRNQNYQNEINSEYARMQPGGACTYRGASCIQDSQLRIQQLMAELQKANADDQNSAAELKSKAEEYAKLEGEGKRYLASQNGEAAPKDADTKLDTTIPTPRQDSSQMGIQNLNMMGNQQLQIGGVNQQQLLMNQIMQLQGNGQYGTQQSLYPTQASMVMPYGANQYGAGLSLNYGAGYGQQGFYQGNGNYLSNLQSPFLNYQAGATASFMPQAQFGLYLGR